MDKYEPEVTFESLGYELNKARDQLFDNYLLGYHEGWHNRHWRDIAVGFVGGYVSSLAGAIVLVLLGK